MINKAMTYIYQTGFARLLRFDWQPMIIFVSNNPVQPWVGILNLIGNQASVNRYPRPFGGLPPPPILLASKCQ